MGSGVKYSQEFRDDAVRLVVEHSRPVRDVAEQAGVRPDTLRMWIHRARKQGLMVAEKKLTYEELEAENLRLRGEMKAQSKELTAEKRRVEFLGKAASFFAAENYDPETGSK